MKDILWTPLPIVIASVIWAASWWSKIAKNKWTTIGRILCLCFISFNVGYWANGWNAKVAAGSRGAEAYLLRQFTTRIEKLIKENKTEKAQELLIKFNEQYPLNAGDYKATNELIQELMKEPQ